MMLHMHDVQLLGPTNEITLLGPDDFGYGYDGLGWGFNPFKAVRRVASGAVNVVKSAGSGAVSVAKTAGGAALKYNPLTLSYKASLWAAEKAVSPIRSRLNTITSRRAAKLAYTRRRSKTPTAAEHAEARNWTKAKLRAKGPHGRLVALLAGPPDAMDGALGDSLGVAPVIAVAAAIPPIVTLLNTLMKSFQQSGEAPANPADQPASPLQTAAAAVQAYQAAQQPAPTAVDVPVTPGGGAVDISPPAADTSADAAAMPDASADASAPTPDTVQGFGADAGTPTMGAIILGALGVAAIGAGVYCAVKR